MALLNVIFDWLSLIAYSQPEFDSLRDEINYLQNTYISR